MKISYNWLKNYLDIDLQPERVKEILTYTGLEVEGLETYESVEGGLEGLVVGKVLEARKHDQADNLTVTKVDVGSGEPLNIVCGAPNVAENQKVVVATPGTMLYGGEKPFKIKKGKFRGELSEGMICAEDEIGLGDDHSGIIVLEDNTPVGKPAREYFNIERDTVFEIDLTPNRPDGASHIGVARDLAAYLSFHEKETPLQYPSVADFAIDKPDNPVDVKIVDKAGCKRYSGITVTGIKVQESPQWLKNRLLSIGIQPINNVVDITNYVLHETGHPLHAFDVDKIDGKKVLIQTLPEETPFKALDASIISLSEEDLMICNENKGMCIAGVFGGYESGVQEETTSVFIESAYFNPLYIRKTAHRHGLSTDASYRFERGTDPNITIYALKRAAMLIKEVAGGHISSKIVDEYPEPIPHFDVKLRFKHIHRILGISIPPKAIRSILKLLDIEIAGETDDGLRVKVPPYRADVQREADVIEEILRIYGYNQIPYIDQVNSAIAYVNKPDEVKISEVIAQYLTASGIHEGMSNSLHPAALYQDLQSFPPEKLIMLENPLSNDLNAMRQTMLFGHLEAVARNINYSNPDVKLYEFGNTHAYDHTVAAKAPVEKYTEAKKLAITFSGNQNQLIWNTPADPTNFYHLKTTVDNLLERLNLPVINLKKEELCNDVFAYGLTYKQKKHTLVQFGAIKRYLLERFDIENDVFFAEVEWETLMKLYNPEITYKPLARYPAVKRDLALLIDKEVTFEQIQTIAWNKERNLLKDVSVFDIYEGEQVPEGKKSYAVSFTLQDETKTLKDKQIDKIMHKLMDAYQKELGAEIR